MDGAFRGTSVACMAEITAGAAGRSCAAQEYPARAIASPNHAKGFIYASTCLESADGGVIDWMTELLQGGAMAGTGGNLTLLIVPD